MEIHKLEINKLKIKDINIYEFVNWLYNNIQSFPKEKDNKFIWPEQLIKNKKGNCIDIAYCIHYFCKLRNIKNIIASVGIEYESFTFNFNSQAHIITLFYIDKWYIGQLSGINKPYSKIINPIYIGTNDLDVTIKNFINDYLPGLRYNIKNQIKHFQRNFYYVLSDKDTEYLELLHKYNYNGNKQDIFHNFYLQHKKEVIR